MPSSNSQKQEQLSFIDRTEGMTSDEWRELPVTFGINDMTRLTRSNWRWTSDHAAELGGRKIAGRWLFSKSEVAKLLGIEV